MLKEDARQAALFQARSAGCSVAPEACADPFQAQDFGFSGPPEVEKQRCRQASPRHGTSGAIICSRAPRSSPIGTRYLRSSPVAPCVARASGSSSRHEAAVSATQRGQRTAGHACSRGELVQISTSRRPAQQQSLAEQRQLVSGGYFRPSRAARHIAAARYSRVARR